jgi:tRNA(fMet)-specific endonuclease VapC
VSGNLAVDSNAYVAFAAGEAEVLALIGAAETVYLPSTVLGELLFGALNSGKKNQNRELVVGFASLCTAISVTPAVADRYATVRFALRQKGKPIPENDLWIAAACIEAEVPLLTADRHFDDVEGLEVRRWVA